MSDVNRAWRQTLSKGLMAELPHFIKAEIDMVLFVLKNCFFLMSSITATCLEQSMVERGDLDFKFTVSF